MTTGDLRSYGIGLEDSWARAYRLEPSVMTVGRTATESGLNELQQWRKRLFEPVDGASAVFFRIAWGGILAKWAWDYMEIGRVRQFYIEPSFHFTYYGLDWIQPWPGEGMIYHFIALLIFAMCVAVGFCYRASSLLFALGFTYVFLLDRTNYQNHYYLIALIAFWMPWLPLNRMVSVDAWLRPSMLTPTVPAWALWILRFHIGLPYFFGGIAKLNADWMLGEPLGQMLASQKDLPILGPWLAAPAAGLCLAWAGLFFDLLVVPALMFPKTRWIAYVACIVFHLMNSVIFNIHVFPWFMLLATPIFFPPDWPRRVLGGRALQLPSASGESPAATRRRNVAIAACAIYVLFQCVWPLRHHVYPGDASWNERGHTFAWRMMLRGKTVVLGYALVDKETGKVEDGRVHSFINPEQSEKFGRDPEMILHLGHFLGERYRQVTGRSAEVHVLAIASLNGRKPVLMIDPNVDLMQQPRGFHEREWLLPQTELLRYPHWDLPPEQWRQHVKIPELHFLTRYTQDNHKGATHQLANSK